MGKKRMHVLKVELRRFLPQWRLCWKDIYRRRRRRRMDRWKIHQKIQHTDGIREKRLGGEEG